LIYPAKEDSPSSFFFLNNSNNKQLSTFTTTQIRVADSMPIPKDPNTSLLDFGDLRS